MKSLPKKPRVPFSQIFPNANPQAVDLLTELLTFDPAKRITVEEALEHPYLAIWHDPADEPVAPTSFDFGFESVNEVPQMQRMILDEVIQFRHHVRNSNLPVPSEAQSEAGSYHHPQQQPQAQQSPQQSMVPGLQAEDAAGRFAKYDRPPGPQEQGAGAGMHVDHAMNDLERELARD